MKFEIVNTKYILEFKLIENGSGIKKDFYNINHVKHFINKHNLENNNKIIDLKVIHNLNIK